MTQELGSVEELGQEKAWRTRTEMRAKDDGNKQKTRNKTSTPINIYVEISSRRQH